MPKIPATLKLKGKLATGEVWVNGRPLSPARSLKVFNHSPTGFSWGYGGSGPTQLAMAILLRYLPAREAVHLHQPFKWKFIASLPFRLPSRQRFAGGPFDRRFIGFRSGWNSTASCCKIELYETMCRGKSSLSEAA